MKVMVMPIDLEIGGSEINAIDLAAVVRSRGHDVVVIGRAGPLGDVARSAGLRVLDVDISRRGRPHPASSRAIRRAIRAEQPDLVHVYEALSCAEAHFAVGMRNSRRIPLIATLYGMNVDEYLPRVVPIVAGTRDIESKLQDGRDPGSIFRLDPPVDTDANRPDAEAGRRQRLAWGVADDEELVVIVSRLDIWMKIDSLMDAIDAVDMLASERLVRLTVVGDGAARDFLERRAAAANVRHGRKVIEVVGHMLDPVPAYQAADVVVGMGTSILRGMAVAKPAVVVGEMGFVQVVNESTIEIFLQQGFWGMGDGTRAAQHLAGLLRGVLSASPEVRQGMGEYGRNLVVERFDLQASADQLLGMYEQVLEWSPPTTWLIGEAVRIPMSVIARKVVDHLPGRRRGVKLVESPSESVEGYLSANAWMPR